MTPDFTPKLNKHFVLWIFFRKRGAYQLRLFLHLSSPLLMCLFFFLQFFFRAQFGLGSLSERERETLDFYHHHPLCRYHTELLCRNSFHMGYRWKQEDHHHEERNHTSRRSELYATVFERCVTKVTGTWAAERGSPRCPFSWRRDVVSP